MNAKPLSRNKRTNIFFMVLLLIAVSAYFDNALAEVTITAAMASCQNDVIYYDDDTSRYYCYCNMISLSSTAVGNISPVIRVTRTCESGCNQGGDVSGTKSWSTEDFYVNGGSNIIRVTAQHQDGSTSTDSINVYYTTPSGTIVTFPYSLNFDSGLDSLEGLTSASKGASVSYEDSLCWSGCAKFGPSSESNSFAALGGFYLPTNSRLVHLRSLIFYGPDYLSNLERRHKHILIHRGSDVSSDRGMVYAWKTVDGSGNLSLGACDNNDCRYEGMYWLLDEVAMSTSHIGPPYGFVTGDDDPNLSENSYVVVNPRLASASVVSLVDNNVITAGDMSLDLDIYERGEFYSTTGPVLHPGMVITGTGPFDLGSGINGTDMPPHVSMSGTAFAMPHTRNSHIYHMMSPHDDARISIEINGEHQQMDLPRGLVRTFDAGETNSGFGAIITSDDTPILLSRWRLSGKSVFRTL
jgi:hypothetical protein